MEEKTQATQRQAETKDENKRKKTSRIAAIAGFSLVGLAVLVLIGTIVINFINSNNKVAESKVTAFKTEKDIAKAYKNIIKNTGYPYVSDANYIKGVSDTKNNGGAATSDDKYIYYLSAGGSDTISVFSAEGENSRLVAEIGVGSDSRPFVFKDFYIDGKKLTAVEEAAITDPDDVTVAYTRVESFDISDIKNIKPVDSFTQSGSVCAAKMLDGNLYVASTFSGKCEADFPTTQQKSSDEQTLPITDIYKSEKPNVPDYLVVSRLSANDYSASDTTALYGVSGGVFFGENSLYAAAYEYDKNLFDKQNRDGASYTHLPVSNTQLIRVDLTDELKPNAAVRISGYIDPEFAIDEKGENLRVISSVTLDNDKFTESANLFVLDKSLKCVGKITDFASNDSIKTVRYIDDTAYVMTYKASDPLFIIDLKSNTEPRILCETKISGFSSTLIPADENTLLSIGYYTAKEDSKDSDGVRIVTFDVSNKTNPKKVDEKTYKNYSSPVQDNPDALLTNAENGEYTIPMIYERYSESKGISENKFGILRFKVEKQKINVVDDFTSTLFSDSDESQATLDRCILVGDCIYLLGKDYYYYKDDGNALIESVVSSQ